MNTTTSPATSAAPPLTRACTECGQPFQALALVLSGRVVYPKRYCDACVERHEQAEVQDLERRKAARLAESWERICPPIYRDTDPTRLPCVPACREAVLGWQFGSRGLLLHGPTRSGKSRLAFLLLSRLHHIQQRRIAAITSTAFSHQVSVLFGDGGGRGEAFIERLASIEVLLLDDIGKGRLTERVEAEFFHVIEHRCSHLLPTILTTNLTADTLAEAWSPDRSAPLVGRLGEFFDDVFVSPHP